MKILVTGGLGFIGSAVIRRLIRDGEHAVMNIDKMTYAASPEAIEDCGTSRRYGFERADIGDGAAMERILATFQPDAILHLAAESHVDRSIDSPSAFIDTNIVGTYRLLEATLRYWQALSPARQKAFRFHHVSTDEVFGTLGDSGAFSEESPYRPNSPYAASKACSDMLVRAWNRTFGLPILISNCSNNFGPYQFPEKLIPTIVLNALDARALPVYGKGTNVRDWLFVDDHARALLTILTKGRVGETYCVGGGAERANIDVVRAICARLDELAPSTAARPHARLISFVTDRPGHDFRYAIDDTKLTRELGWAPQESFETGLDKTVRWYLDHRDWCQDIRRRGQATERVGLAVRRAAGGTH